MSQQNDAKNGKVHLDAAIRIADEANTSLTRKF